jgi:pimeloyl-ACP methyl ester carboxylesterase
MQVRSNMSKMLVNGINFHYWQVGEGPDVVMLHGLNGNLAVWHLKMVPELRTEYRITTYDLRGHGRSDMPPTGYTTEDMANDLLGIMDALEIERAHLVGHSLGADISLHFGLLYPDRVDKMVLLEPAIPALVNLRRSETWEGWAYWVHMLKIFTGVEVPRERWNDLDYLIRLSVEIPILYGPARGLPRKKEPTLRLLDTTTIVKDYEVAGSLTLENLGKIPHPKLLIYDGGSPYMGTYDVIRDLLINCTPILLPPSDLRHFSPLEQPEILLEHMRAFFQSDETENTPAQRKEQE